MAGEAGPSERARLLYDQAVFGGDYGALATADRVLDTAEAALSLARGRVMHARFLAERHEQPGELVLFERAAALYHKLGDTRGEGESLLWAGTFHQVVRDDGDTALPVLERAQELAKAADDKLTLSYTVRHLGFADMAAGRLDAARERLEESVQLRREIGFMPGVAAGVLALAKLAAQSGDRDRALTLLDEAAAIAAEAGAYGIMRWIDAAREECDLCRLLASPGRRYAGFSRAELTQTPGRLISTPPRPVRAAGPVRHAPHQPAPG